MEEIFINISNEIKQGAKLVFDAALKTQNPITMIKILDEYTKNCLNEEEQDFVRFYFNLRMEQIFNDSNNVKW